MVLIGELSDKNIAEEIVACLVKRGIIAKSVFSQENDVYQVFIEDQKDIEEAEDIFRVRTGGKKLFTPSPEWQKIQELKAKHLTFPVMIVCIIVFLVPKIFLPNFYQYLLFGTDQNFSEILSYEVWRIITPCFIHFGFLHIFFNLMWWKDLSKIIEHTLGTKFLIIFFILVGSISNFSQYMITGPSFGGMSGIIFGLFGLIWMLGKFSTSYTLVLPKSDIVMMVGWFILCLTGALNFSIANMAHAVGLGLGMITGIIISFRDTEERIKKYFFLILSFAFMFLGQF